MVQAPARPDCATRGGSRARGGGERGKQPLDAGQGGGAAGVEDLEAWMAEIGAWHDKHSSSGKLADSRHQLDWPDKAKTARASEVTSSRVVVVTGGWPIVRLVEGQTCSILKEDRMTVPARPSPIPDSYRRVTPCLTVQGAGKALEFYAAVFGAAERMRFPGPGGTIAHAEIQIGDSVVIVEDEDPQRGTKAPPPGGLPGSPASLYIYVEDVDAVIARAAELGATVQRPAEDQFYGDRDGHIIDPFGHGWTVASHVEDVTADEMMRRMAELYG